MIEFYSIEALLKYKKCLENKPQKIGVKADRERLRLLHEVQNALYDKLKDLSENKRGPRFVTARGLYVYVNGMGVYGTVIGVTEKGNVEIGTVINKVMTKMCEADASEIIIPIRMNL